MQVSNRLLQAAARVKLTLFTRPNCSLCQNAKLVVRDVSTVRHFEYNDVDVMKSSAWKVYEFDVPVVGDIPPSLSSDTL